MKNLKKLSILAASALLAVAFLAAGCGSDSASSGSSSKNTTVTVAQRLYHTVKSSTKSSLSWPKKGST